MIAFLKCLIFHWQFETVERMALGEKIRCRICGHEYWVEP